MFFLTRSSDRDPKFARCVIDQTLTPRFLASSLRTCLWTLVAIPTGTIKQENGGVPYSPKTIANEVQGALS